MDNLAHALAGAALGQAGLKRISGLGTATLVVAANLPDIDIVSAFAGRSLAWRRGWTHGPVALLVLPVLLGIAMIAFDRWQAGRGSRPPTRLPVQPLGLLLLAYIGILSHLLMDLLNTYGVRFLMPFSAQWFYGDALFIIDVWVWIALALGVLVSRHREKRHAPHSGRPAIASLLAATAYAVAMGAASAAAERLVVREIIARGLPPPASVLASPVPLDPFRRRIIYETDGAFGFGDLRWRPFPRLTLEPGLVRTNMDDPAIAAAAAGDERVGDFLSWSRLPFAEVSRTAAATHVTIGDARYSQTPGTGVFTVRATIE